jgi:hypothetical protein
MFTYALGAECQPLITDISRRLQTPIADISRRLQIPIA